MGCRRLLLCGVLLWYDGYSGRIQWTVDLLLLVVWLGVAFNLKQRVVRPLQTLSNILGALREGDYSIRGRRALSGDALGEVMLEVNELGQTLREQRLGALEATALLRTVMSEIDLAVFAFDADERLRLINRAGERLLAQPAARLLGRTGKELSLSDCLQGPDDGTQIVQMVFPGGVGRWGVRRSVFREGGVPHQLLVLTDLSQTLREEERTAWQRLLRVLGHELNNSLAPIKSVATSLADLLGREPQPVDLREDIQRGLEVISSRADSLARFVESYSKLARLPQPRFEPLERRRAGPARRQSGNASAGRCALWSGRAGSYCSGRSGTAGTVADQSGAQRRRCRARNRWPSRDWLVTKPWTTGHLGQRRRTRPGKHGESVCAFLYHQS